MDAPAIADVATNLGRTVTLRKATQAAYDPATDSFGTDTTTDYSVVAIMRSTLVRYDSGVRVIDDVANALMGADGIAAIPEPGDVLIDGGTRYQIGQVRVIKPAGTVLAYVCILGDGA